MVIKSTQRYGLFGMQQSGHGFAALWMAALFSFSLCQENCRLPEGQPGQAGTPGRNGWPGQKGDKGEPGLQVQLSKEALAALKGDQGKIGPLGEIGPDGYEGLLGPPGPAGPPGPSGSTRNSGDGGARKAAFSVVRTRKDPPRYEVAVTFDKALTNLNDNFNLATGKFTCKIPGVYYFVFHSVSLDNLCLKLRSNSKPDLGLTFCDFNQRKQSQVLSGGAVLELAKDNEVWITPIKSSEANIAMSNGMNSNTETTAVFSGFLVFATG